MGAFVYGLMSFGEKIFNGIAVVILEKMNTCDLEALQQKEDAIARNITVKACTKPECEFYGKFVSFGTSGILLIGLVFVFIQKYGIAEQTIFLTQIKKNLFTLGLFRF